MSSLKKSLKNQYYKDVESQKNRTIKHKFGFNMKYIAERECFIGISQYCKHCSVVKGKHPEYCIVKNKKFVDKLNFEKGIELEVMQDVSTMVPIYWMACSNKIENKENGETKICGEHELIGIWEEGDAFDCRKCKFTNTIKLILDPKSEQYKLLQKIKGEE